MPNNSYFALSEERIKDMVSLAKSESQVKSMYYDYSYTAAYYILTSNTTIWRAADKGCTRDGISFAAIRKAGKGTFSTSTNLLVDLAASLFNGSKKIAMDDLCGYLDNHNMTTAIRAIHLRYYGLTLSADALSRNDVL